MEILCENLYAMAQIFLIQSIKTVHLQEKTSVEGILRKNLKWATN